MAWMTRLGPMWKWNVAAIFDSTLIFDHIIGHELIWFGWNLMKLELNFWSDVKFGAVLKTWWDQFKSIDCKLKIDSIEKRIGDFVNRRRCGTSPCKKFEMIRERCWIHANWIFALQCFQFGWNFDRRTNFLKMFGDSNKM